MDDGLGVGFDTKEELQEIDPWDVVVDADVSLLSTLLVLQFSGSFSISRVESKNTPVTVDIRTRTDSDSTGIFPLLYIT